MPRFDRALVRSPAATFAAGLTQAGLGAPDFELALAQHAAYCAALARAGLEIVRLPPDADFPDSTFVEDTAVVTAHGVVLTRPGAASRAGETAAIAAALAALGVEALPIEPPGTVDGGDVCETDDGFLIGLSSRTDEEGARQLAARLADWGYRAATIDVRALGPALLHLKSGLSELGDGRLAVVPELAGHPALAGRELVVVQPGEAYAANCIRVNDRVLVADGFPRFAAELERLGYRVERLAMSEFRKMDGGLSCLSLRLPADLAGGAAST
jgi:dimethylargininase